MSESSSTEHELPKENPVRRCPNCDSVVPASDTRCLMCGAELATQPDPEAPTSSSVVQSTDSEPPEESRGSEVPPVVVSVMKERQSNVTFWFTAVFAVFIVVLGTLVLRYQGPTVTIALVPTTTPLPPTVTYTPTWTPLPAQTPLPDELPTLTPTAEPTETPQPPRIHSVNSGETLIGLSLRFRVSVESIANLNGFSPDSSIQVGQALEIPWPTATPPMVPVAVTVRGVSIVADPTDCQMHQVMGGDSISRIAAQYDVDFELLMKVNRLTEDSILRPGDALCIPEIIIGGVLPPTPGPSPTPSPTLPPAGPRLLFPVNDTVIDPPDGIVTLQWTAVKDLTESEWYMVELTDLSDVDSLPKRDFTRDTSFQLPSSWRPAVAEPHRLQWRISIVQVTGTRSDGLKIYTYGGESSEAANFTWLGAVPTPTPTITPSPVPEQ